MSLQSTIMKPKSNVWMYRIVLVCVLVVVAVFGTWYLQEQTTEQDGSKEIFFKSVDLSLSGTPSLNQPVELTCTVIATPFMGSNSSIKILLPDGFELVSGNLSWKGYIEKNNTVQVKAIIKAVETGNWMIGAWAGPSWNEKYDRANLYVSVS